jgi:hypothetical protein
MILGTWSPLGQYWPKSTATPAWYGTVNWPAWAFDYAPAPRDRSLPDTWLDEFAEALKKCEQHFRSMLVPWLRALRRTRRAGDEVVDPPTLMFRAVRVVRRREARHSAGHHNFCKRDL